MKCIKTKSGDIKRLDDKSAEQLVRSEGASYVPKHEWKKVRGKK